MIRWTELHNPSFFSNGHVCNRHVPSKYFDNLFQQFISHLNIRNHVCMNISKAILFYLQGIKTQVAQFPLSWGNDLVRPPWSSGISSTSSTKESQNNFFSDSGTGNLRQRHTSWKSRNKQTDKEINFYILLRVRRNFLLRTRIWTFLFITVVCIAN